MGLFSAILEAIMGEDNRIGGISVTKLLSPLSETETTEMIVESTIGFGENVDGANDARLLIGGEIITATGRTVVAPFKFTTLTRAVDNTKAKLHPAGTLVLDLSRNTSAIDLVRRGFAVNTAIGEDLNVIGRNLGLHKCPGLTDAVYREIIKAVAYLPKTTKDAFERALTALVGAGNFSVRESIITDPWKVFIEIDTTLSTSLQGRFVLNGGEQRLTTGLTTVTTVYPINHVIGVFRDDINSRRGHREGLTNYFSSFVGSTITLAPSPGPIGTAVIVDYGAHKAHYLADDETILHAGDFYAYLSDPLLAAACLLDQVRAAGIKVDLRVRY